MFESAPSCSFRRSDSSAEEEEKTNRPETHPKKRKYYQTYNRRWEDEPDLRGWLQASKKVLRLPYCRNLF